MPHNVCKQAGCTTILVHKDEILCEIHFGVLKGRIQTWITDRLEKNRGRLYLVSNT